MMRSLLVLSIISATLNCYPSTFVIGTAQLYTTPGQVSNLVADGDSVLIEGGIYLNDAVKWNKRNLKIIGLGGASNRTILRCTTDIPNGKGIFVFENPGTSDDAYIENIVFDGAQVSDADGANGAGIRFQANNLTVKNCLFMNCQNGILEGNANVNSSNVILTDCEFFNNGYQLPNDPNYSGYEHHIYIGASTDTLLVEHCHFHHPRGQANSIKTRAQRSFILYNFIDEEATGYGSWEINIAQGGLNIIMGNIIIQDIAGANHGIIGYDAAVNPIEDFYFINNTVINKFQGNIKFLNIAPPSGINSFRVYNNVFASVPAANNTMFTGNVPVSIDTMSNILSADYTAMNFTDVSANDYTLTALSTEAIDHGSIAGSASSGYLLDPLYEYTDSILTSRSIAGVGIDIGAYEYNNTVGIYPDSRRDDVLVYPNPFHSVLNISTWNSDKIRLFIYDLAGKLIYSSLMNNNININTKGFPNGPYTIVLYKTQEKVVRNVVKN